MPAEHGAADCVYVLGHTIVEVAEDRSAMSLSEDDIARSLERLDGWQRSGIEIAKTFDRKNFDGSLRFINAVAVEANAQDHHPDIALSWNEVVLTLSSHDVSALTERDFRLAAAIDRIATTID